MPDARAARRGQAAAPPRGRPPRAESQAPSPLHLLGFRDHLGVRVLGFRGGGLREGPRGDAVLATAVGEATVAGAKGKGEGKGLRATNGFDGRSRDAAAAGLRLDMQA